MHPDILNFKDFYRLSTKNFFEKVVCLSTSEKCRLLNHILLKDEYNDDPELNIDFIYPADLPYTKGETLLCATFLVREIVKSLDSHEEKVILGDHLYDWLLLHDDTCREEEAQKVFEVIHILFDCYGVNDEKDFEKKLEKYPTEKIEDLIVLQRFKDVVRKKDVQTIGFIPRGLHFNYISTLYQKEYEKWKNTINGDPTQQMLNAIRKLKPYIIKGSQRGEDLYLSMINIYGHAEAI